MNNIYSSVLSRLPLSCAWLSLILGITVIWGWHSQNPLLIQVFPTFVPMQYNTAIGFVVCGLGVMTLSREMPTYAQICGTFLMLLGCASLSQYVFGVNLGIDELLMDHYIDVKSSHPGRMAPNTALCFTLVGIAFVATSSITKLYLATSIGGNLAAAIFSLAIVALIGYSIGIGDSYGWESLTKMAVHTSVGFVVIGVGLFTYCLSTSYLIIRSYWPSWLVSAAVFAGLSLTFAIWQEIRVYELKLIEQLGLSASVSIMVEESALGLGLLATFIAVFYLWGRVKSEGAASNQVEQLSAVPSRIYAGTLLVGILLSISIYQVLHVSYQNNTKTRFNGAVNIHIQSVVQGINLYLDTTYDLRAALSSAEVYTRSEFEKLTRRDIKSLPGLVSIQWAPKVTRAERANFEQQSINGEPILIKELNEQGQLVVVPERDVYYPVYYAEPLADNYQALGFDLNSNPRAEAAIPISIEQDNIYVSERVTLVQSKNQKHGLIIQLPVYRLHEDNTNQTLIGFAVTVIDIAQMVEDVLNTYTEPTGFDLTFEDVNASEGNQLVYKHISRMDRTLTEPGMSHTREINFANATWRITGELVNDERYPAWSWMTFILPAFTLLFSFFIAQFLRKNAIRDRERSTLISELATKEAHYSTLVDTIPGTVFIARLDDNYTIEYISSEVAELSAYPPEDFVNNKQFSFFSIAHEEDKPLLFESLKQAISSQKELTCEYRLTTRNGQERNIYLKGKTLFNKKQGQTLLHATAIDITAQKRSEKQFENLLETAPDAMVIINELGEILIANQQTESMFGYSKAELIGQKIELLMPERFKALHPSDRNKFFLNPTVRAMGYGNELVGLTKDGREIPVEISLSPMKRKDGVVVSAAIRDVTERNRMQNDLVVAMEKAQAATQAKSEFLANMSHEIRTPMNSIIGMSYLALQTELTNKQRSYIEKTHQSAESLLGIINDILDFSKIEAGQLTIEKVPFELGKTLDSLANIIGLKAEEKGIELVFDTPADVTQRLIGDPLRLLQILINLSNNAIKFTEQGDVVVSISQTSIQGDTVNLRFEISDTGIGMTQEQQDKLFKSFSQGDTSVTRKFGGTGLGLAICKNLTELMGGEIAVSSMPLQGSCFSFTLPFEIDRTVSATTACTSLDLGAFNVLVVDDNKSSRDILSTILEGFTVNVTTCESGREAIELIKVRNQDAPFHFVFMDWKMPELDGIETTRIIQSDPNIKQVPTFIMVTAFKREEAIIAASDIKLKAFLTKPVTPSTLLDTMLNVGQEEGTVALPTMEHTLQSDASTQLVGAKVLLVEDNGFNQAVATELLQLHQIEVDVANHGLEAIQMLNKNDYDGVLMDCQMPVLDGYSATERIREMPQYQSLPIIAMTANAMAGDKEKALASGMNDHIAKPVKVETMLSTMAKWIKPAHPQRLEGIETSTEQVIDLNETIASIEKIPPLDFMDRKQALDYSANSVELVLSLMSRFAKEQSGFAAELNKLILQDDLNAALRTVHSLKSNAASLGLKAIAELAQEIEHSMKTAMQRGDNFDSLSKPISELNALLEEATHTMSAALAEQAVDNQTENAHTDTKTLSAKQTIALIGKLKASLETCDTACIEECEALLRNDFLIDYHGQLQMIQQSIEEFDFDAALAKLSEFYDEIGALCEV